MLVTLALVRLTSLSDEMVAMQTCEVYFLLSTITYNNDFFDSFGIFLQFDVVLIGRAYGYQDVFETDIGNFEFYTRTCIQSEMTVQIGDGSIGCTHFEHGCTNYRRTMAIGYDAEICLPFCWVASSVALDAFEGIGKAIPPKKSIHAHRE